MSGLLIGPMRARAHLDPANGFRHQGWLRWVALRGRVRPHLLGELAVIGFLLYVYDAIRSQAALRASAALHHAQSVLGVEHGLRIDVEHTANAWASAHADVSRFFATYYEYLHLSVTMLVLVICYWRAPMLYRHARNALVLVNLVGLVVYYLYPVAPPRLLPGAGFVDTVARAGYGTNHGGPITADQFGAMPSLHLAWAVWTAVVVLCLTGRRWIRALALAHPVLMTTAVLVTANHYLLDVVAGSLVALAALLVVSFVASLRPPGDVEDLDPGTGLRSSPVPR